jgi:phosphoribosylaminoimidazole carboxylase (NCAIR synthetase)
LAPSVEIMSESKLLIVGSTVITSWGRDQIRRLSEQARRRGVRLVGADTSDNLAGARAEELDRVDEIVALDVHDVTACRDWARSRPDIDAVVTIRELAVYPAAVMARVLGAAGNDPAAVHRIRNKDLCRERLRAAGFPQPRTAICGGAQAARRFMRETAPGPWIVKPRDGLASIGVSRVEGDADLPAALANFGSPPSAMGPLPQISDFLIETFVSGEEFSAEGFLRDGIPQVMALTRKDIAAGFIETGHRVPAGLDDATAAAASDAVAAALTEAGISRGIFHVEFWVTNDGIVLGELHDRPGGDFIHALVEQTRPGLEFYGAVVDDLLDLAPQPVPEPKGAAGAAFLLSPPGRLTAVRGWDELARHPAVLAADLQVTSGDTITPVTDSFGRHGVVVVGADTAEEVDRLLADLTKSVVFEVT